jgi:hypothetical protein
VLFSPNPDGPLYDEAQRKQITRDHLAWAQAQFESGNAVLAGAIADHPQFNGMGVFCLGSPERVRAVMAEDPAITSGVDTYQLAQFVTRAGAIKRLRDSAAR